MMQKSGKDLELQPLGCFGRQRGSCDAVAFQPCWIKARSRQGNGGRRLFFDRLSKILFDPFNDIIVMGLGIDLRHHVMNLAIFAYDEG